MICRSIFLLILNNINPKLQRILGTRTPQMGKWYIHQELHEFIYAYHRQWYAVILILWMCDVEIQILAHSLILISYQLSIITSVCPTHNEQQIITGQSIIRVFCFDQGYKQLSFSSMLLSCGHFCAQSILHEADHVQRKCVNLFNF